MDCEPKIAVTSTPKQGSPATGSESRLEDCPVSRLDDDIKCLKNNKKKSKHDSGLFVISKVQKHSSPLLKPPEDLAKDETLGRKDETLGRPVRVVGPTFNKEDGVFEAKSSVSNTCISSRGSDWVNIDKKAQYVNVRTSSINLNEYLNIVEPNLLDCGDRELDGIYSDEVAESVKTKESLVPTRNQIPEHIYLPAQPIMEPIWR
ncbi:hypothetical protein COLO4_16619 [Corchorus olitorius]|uniref:Uncharacterized protein n=1 Tax=Corchorus olitorius TaxID=93759 RepID=A0A1R3JGJ0_9ROSI|nr:hypothetical protein COLO4_16619 [Corchorus olitorius]